MRRLIVPTVPDEASLASLLRLDQRVDGLAPFQHVQLAGVELDQVHIVGSHPSKAAVYRLLDDIRGPGLVGRPTCDVAALGRQDILVAPVGHSAPDELLGGPVAGRSVEEIDAGVKCHVEHPATLRYFAPSFMARDPRHTKPQARNLKTGIAEGGPRHGLLPRVI